MQGNLYKLHECIQIKVSLEVSIHINSSYILVSIFLQYSQSNKKITRNSRIWGQSSTGMAKKLAGNWDWNPPPIKTL